MLTNTKIASLYKWERYLYFFVWSAGIAYSIYMLSFINIYFSNYHDLYTDFAPGWSWIGKKQDISDQEWRAWIPLMIELMPWILFHHFISHIIKTTLTDTVLCCWYIFVPASFLYYYIGMLGTICALIQPISLYILAYKCRKTIIWLVHLSFLFVIHFLKMPDGLFQDTLRLNDEEHYILTLTMCWIQLRSISCTIDNINNSTNKGYKTLPYFVKNFLWNLAYCLYLPTLFLGPLILYNEFMDSMKGPFQSWNLNKLKEFIVNTIRYTFWVYITQFSLHFIYFNAIQYHPEIVQVLNSWTLYGLGYCMGQFFLIKYVVVYGFNRTLCALDDVKAPPQPKCIARIHLYSDMWKYFDRGLYKFLVRYIYTPILELNYNRLLGSFLCFTFVFIWHGMQINIFIWALLNFVGLNIETVARSIGKSEYYTKIQEKYTTPENARRFNCMLASPLLAMSAISNFYFFAGEEIGNIYIRRIFHDSCSTLFILLFFLYCCCQVSIEVKHWESKKNYM